MKPAPFAYERPGSVADAVAILAADGVEAKPLAGGQSLIPLLNFRLSRPSVIVDLGWVPGLDRIAVGPDGSLHVGAMVRQARAEADDLVGRRWPIIVRALAHVGHRQIRERGTVGGSIAHADPAAELPAVFLACGGEVSAASVRGTRSIDLDGFFSGPFATGLEPDELLVDIRLDGIDRGSIAEVARRRGDFALAGVAATRRADHFRLVAFGLGWAPLRLTGAEALLDGGEIDPAAVAAVARSEVDPLEDIHADAETRRELIETLVARLIPEVVG